MTGDLGWVDENGYLRITGRKKDVIIRGGENIYPREIEEFLYRHPKIQDVQVIGIPDDRYGEEICAWVKLRPGVSATEEEIRAFCRDQIAHYKVPRYIKFVDEFPMTVTGKIPGLPVRNLTGDLTTSPSTAAQGNAQITYLGQDISADFVVVDGDLYTNALNPGDKTMTDIGPASQVYDPSAILNPDTGLPNVLANFTDAKAEGKHKNHRHREAALRSAASENCAAPILPFQWRVGNQEFPRKSGVFSVRGAKTRERRLQGKVWILL